MKNNRTLYGTLGIATMGLMSSSFFGSTESHPIYSVSLSELAPPIAQPGSPAAVSPPKQAPRGARKKSADSLTADSINTTTPNAIDQASTSTPAAVAPAAAPVAAAATPAAAPAAKKVDEAVATKISKAAAIETSGIIELKKSEPADKPISSVMSQDGKYTYYLRTEGPVIERQDGVKEKTVRAFRTEGTFCEDCSKNASRYNAPVSSDGTVTTEGLGLLMSKIDEQENAKVKKELDEKIANCDIGSDEQKNRVDGNEELSGLVCKADAITSKSKHKKDKDTDDEAVDKDAWFKDINDEVSDLALANDSGSKSKLHKLMGAIKDHDLRAKLKTTIDDAQIELLADTRLKEVRKMEAGAIKEYNAAIAICPSLAPGNGNMQGNRSWGATIPMNQNQGSNTCNQYTAIQAQNMINEARQIMYVDRSGAGIASPSRLEELVAKEKTDGGLTQKQVDPTIKSYVDFSIDYQKIMGQPMLTAQDRQALTGIEGMESSSPGQNQMDTGIATALNRQALDTNSWRGDASELSRIPLTYPGLNIAGMNSQNGLNGMNSQNGQSFPQNGLNGMNGQNGNTFNQNGQLFPQNQQSNGFHLNQNTNMFGGSLYNSGSYIQPTTNNPNQNFGNQFAPNARTYRASSAGLRS